MADYIYLLENRLTGPQQRAIGTVRSIARSQDLTLFLTGGAVRDMTGGGPIRDLDLTVQGNALQLRTALESAGAEVYGEHPASQRLFLRFAGGVRMEVSSAMAVAYPTPGKPEYQPAPLIEALRGRDFTANAMAISLNDGSYGLLMDPLNGVADIENRELRLVSNYGFIEDPSRLIRAARLRARLGWQLEERTAQRYETAREEGYMKALSPWHRGYELEEIFHEEDTVRVLRALETEGWLSAVSPTLNAAKANVAALNDVAERQGQLLMQGLVAQSAAINFPLVTAKMSPTELSDLKTLFVRDGFLREIESLEAKTRDFANQLGGKEMAAPSAAWRMLHAAEPNLVLSAAYSSKSSVLQARLKTFLNDSPTARQRIPYVLLQEMRITPDLPGYDELLERLFFELMDGRLSTTEEMKAFLEPYSPPAPPPPVNLRRARAKKEARPSRAKGKKAAEAEEMPGTVAAEEEAAGVATGMMESGTLTGPDRGPEPTPHEPLQGKVAPEPGQIVGAVEPRKIAKAAARKPSEQGEGKVAAAKADARSGSAARSAAGASAPKKQPVPPRTTAVAIPARDAVKKSTVRPGAVEPSARQVPTATTAVKIPEKKGTALAKQAEPAKRGKPVVAKQVAAKQVAAKQVASGVVAKPGKAQGTASKVVRATAQPAKVPPKAAPKKQATASKPAQKQAAPARTAAGTGAARKATKAAPAQGKAPAKAAAKKRPSGR